MSVFKSVWCFPVCLMVIVQNATAQKQPAPEEMKLAALPLSATDPKSNPSSAEKVALGRLLFFDPVLSATQKVACSTCHHPKYGWADGRTTPLGVGGRGLGPERLPESTAGIKPLPRNTPGLMNVGFNGLVSGKSYDPREAPMFLDAREKGLEAQVFHPVRSRDEMRGNRYPIPIAVAEMVKRVDQIEAYRQRFARVYPEKEITAKRIAEVIAAFERSLVAANSPFDRFMRGDQSAMTAQQQRGMETFQKAGCTHCHGGPMFSDFKPHFIGVSGLGLDAQRPMRTPTLRNLRFTAPYFHHGGTESLDEVMNFYEQLMDIVSETLDGGDAVTVAPLDPLLKHLQLEVEDFPDVLAFLDALNDSSYDKSEPNEVPSGLPVNGE